MKIGKVPVTYFAFSFTSKLQDNKIKGDSYFLKYKNRDYVIAVTQTYIQDNIA